MDHLIQLKKIGHNKLDEYIALDISYKSKKRKRERAYEKLARKLNVPLHKAHFSQMVTAIEIQTALSALDKLIVDRKKKTASLGLEKRQIAPNVMELQRLASNLNIR